MCRSRPTASVGSSRPNTSPGSPVDALGALTLPYLAVIRRKLGDIDINIGGFEFSAQQASECYGILQEKLTNPCLLELIWSYWHEEGMLVQTSNAITRRFQNVRGSRGAGSAGQPGGRSAAAAQQPAVGLRPGRTASPERRPPQLRVRPPLRSAARRPRGPGHEPGRHRARSSSKRSTTCCACARRSSSRTTTRRSRRTRSRC